MIGTQPAASQSHSPSVSQKPPVSAIESVAPSRLLQLSVFAALFALTVVLQYLSGAFHSEFGGYPDETAHYVTSLMVREYIAGPHPLSPLQFAAHYYNHYPKVAFGHWPPVFYILQACWMLVFSASRASVRLEIAFTTALLSFVMWRFASRAFGNIAGLLAAALLICLPLVQMSTDQEMAEPLLVLFCLLSTLYFGRFLDTGSRSDVLWYGVYFSLAVLTKGSGWLLVFIPLVAVLLTRKIKFLFKPSFWLSVLLIAALCLPWQLMTIKSVARGWSAGTHPSVGYTLKALAFLLQVVVSVTGPVLTVVILLGIIAAVILPFRSRRVSSLSAVMFALLVGDIVFHALVPAGVEDRKVIIAVPALIYFLFCGGVWLADHLPLQSGLLRWRRPMVALLAALLFLAQAFRIPHDPHFGYTEAATYVNSDPLLRNGVLLVSSEYGGEGLLISEVAMQEPRPHATLLRATKELADVDWTGEAYHSRISSPADFLAYLRKRHVTAIVFDTNRSNLSFPHQKIIERTVAQNPNRFSLAAVFPGESNTLAGKVRIYKFNGL